MEKKLLKLSALSISACVLSCTSSTSSFNSSNDFTTKSNSLETRPSATIDKSLLEQTKPQKVDISQTKVIDMSIPKQELKPTFNDFPSEPSNSNEINIMYKDEYFVRVDKKANKIIRNDKFNYDLLMNLLNKYKLVNVRDASTGSQEEDDKIEKRTTEYYNTDIPNYSSMHYYEFPRGTNTNELCKLLRELPFVLTAYPKPTLVSAAATNIGKQTSNSYTGNRPYTTWYNNNSESSWWWWYNAERIFHGWDYYKSKFAGNYYGCSSDIQNCPKPLIAVIDNAFDKNSSDSEKPNYLTGVYIDKFNNQTAGDIQPAYNSSDLYGIDANGYKFYHGEGVASVAANPGGGIGTRGISPGAQILPIRVLPYSTVYSNRLSYI